MMLPKSKDWDTAQQKLQSLFPDKAVHAKITAKLLNKEVDRRLEYVQDEGELVRACSEELLI